MTQNVQFSPYSVLRQLLPFCFDFRQLSCLYFLQFSPIFLHCCLCIWYLHCLRHKNKFVHWTAMAQWTCSFCRDVILMIPLRYSFQSYSHRFFGIDNTNIFGLVFPNIAASFAAAIYLCFTRHCWWHLNFPTFYEHFSLYSWIPHHQDQWRKYHAIFWYYRALVSR